MLRMTTIVASAFFCTVAFAQQNPPEPIYRFDPTLSVEEPRRTTLSADPQQIVVIKKDERETNLRLQTETPISPYLGTEHGPELSPEELRLLPEGKARDGLGDYKLEAGVGLYVEDKASLNLGYRFQNPPSLLNDRSNDPLTLTGDLRITFDIKVPFD